MEKLMWTKPELNEIVFPANAYCAACGDPLSTTYKFICTAVAGPLYYFTNAAQTAWEYLGSYNPCSEKHDVTVQAGEDKPFYEGFVDYDGDEKESDGEHVAVWIEWDSYQDWVWDERPSWGNLGSGHFETITYVEDAHAMKALNTSVIEADKS